MSTTTAPTTFHTKTTTATMPPKDPSSLSPPSVPSSSSNTTEPFPDFHPPDTHEDAGLTSPSFSAPSDGPSDGEPGSLSSTTVSSANTSRAPTPPPPPTASITSPPYWQHGPGANTAATEAVAKRSGPSSESAYAHVHAHDHGHGPGHNRPRSSSGASAESALPAGAIQLRDNEGDGGYGYGYGYGGNGADSQGDRGAGNDEIQGFLTAPIHAGDRAGSRGYSSQERNRACWARSVRVTDHVVVGGGATNIGAFVVWNIKVETLNGSHMNIRKRYSEFDDFRRRLTQTFPDYDAAVPSLPPKSVVQKFRPRFLEKRRAGLQYFLNCVLLNPDFSGSPVLKEFLFS